MPRCNPRRSPSADARRTTVGVAVGAVLALATVPAAYAHWQVQQTVHAQAVSGGDLSLQVSWAKPEQWGAIAPGGTVSNHARVTVGGAGDNLRVQLRADAENARAFDAHITRTISLDDCTADPGPLFPSAGYPAGGTLAPGSAVSVCVRYTLAPTAPPSLQGADLKPEVTFEVVQRPAP